VHTLKISLDSRTPAINGRSPRLPVVGSISVAGKSIAFIAAGNAGNAACR
jgi:hypothetical protein